jgi:histidinol phosphatase-like enzyme
MQNQKTVDQINDIELAVLIRDNMNNLQAAQNNLVVLNQELEARQKRQNAPQEEKAPEMDKDTPKKK